MPNRSKTDIVERVKLLEEEVYPSGTNTPDTVTAGEDGKLDLVNTGEIDIGKLVSALDVSGYDITGVGELESDSLNTEGLNSTKLVDADEGQSNFETVISNNPAGTYYFVHGSELTVTSPPWDITKEVHLRAVDDVTLKLADGFDDDTAEDVIRFRDGADGSSINGFEIDGNRANQTVSTFGNGNPGAHGIYLGYADTPEYCDRVTVENCYIHDTIRSGIAGYSSDSTFKDLHIKNAAHDHWMYFGAMDDCTAEDIFCEGYARGTGFQVSSDPVTGNTIRDLTVKNVTTNPYDDNILAVVAFNDVAGCEDNKLIDADIDTTDYGGRVNRIEVQHPDVTIRDVNFRVSDSGQPVIRTRLSGTDATLENVNVTLENDINGNATTLFSLEADNPTVNNCSAVSNVTSVTVRAYQTKSSSDWTIVNSVADVADFALNVDGGVRGWAENFHDAQNAGVNTFNGADFATNGYTTESANAETPQGDYRDGTIVDFTDSGDGSGTGVYLMTAANGAVQIQ